MKRSALCLVDTETQADANFDYPYLVSWAAFLDPSGAWDLLKPQMVSPRVEL